MTYPSLWPLALMSGVLVSLIVLLLVAAYPRPVDAVAEYLTRVVRRWL